METESIKKLTENFFINLKCNIAWDNNVLIVNKVPQDFEKLYEKSSPYAFSFDEETSKNIPESELITKGSLLLKLMANYLNNKAQTTILKLNFEPDLKEMITSSIDFKDHQISNINKTIKYDYIFRFTFLTTLQYLNEKEQIITAIHMMDNKILEDFNTNKYQTLAGKKEEIKSDLSEETKASYNIAKENLKTKLQGKTKEVSELLQKSQESAFNRINSHINHRIEELQKIHNSNIKNLQLSKEKLPKTNEKNKQVLLERIKRLEETINNSKINEEIEKLEKEKQFFLNDEKQKHSVNLNNSLMNTTIIYYPIFDFNVKLKTKNIKDKEISFNFNPLNNELSKIHCESCKQEIDEIILCDINHLSCKSCIKVCPRCGKKKCKSCKQISCNVCSGEICEKCATLCTKCLKYACISDIRKDNTTGKDICTRCSDFCTSCNKFAAKDGFKRCDNCKQRVCRKCLKSKYINGKTLNLCNQCYPKINNKPFRI